MHKHVCADKPAHKMVSVQSELKVVVKGLLFLFYLCEVEDSNLKPESNYPDRRYLVITEVIQALVSHLNQSY
jgi:hypothetical protein